MNLMILSPRKLMLIIALGLVGAAGAFLLQNIEPVDVTFLLWNVRISKGLVVSGAFGLGIVTGVFISAAFYLMTRK